MSDPGSLQGRSGVIESYRQQRPVLCCAAEVPIALETSHRRDPPYDKTRDTPLPNALGIISSGRWVWLPLSCSSSPSTLPQRVEVHPGALLSVELGGV